MGRGVQGHAAWKPNEIDPVMPGDGSEILSQPRVAAKRTTRVWERTRAEDELRDRTNDMRGMRFM